MRTATLVAVFILVLAAAAALIVAWPSMAAWGVLLFAASLPFVKTGSHRRDPFEIIYAFVAYFFVGIGLRGLLLQTGWLKNKFWIPIQDEPLIVRVYLFSALGLLSLYAGYYARFSSRWGKLLGGRIRKTLPTYERDWLLTLFSSLCAVAGLLSFYLFYQRFSYLIQFGENPGQVAKLANFGGIYYLTMMSYFPIVGAVISTTQRLTPTRGAVLIGNLAAALLWTGVDASKAILIDLVLGIMIARHYLRSPWTKKVLIPVALLGLVLLSAGFYYRDYGFDLSSWAGALQGSVLAGIVEPVMSRSYQFDMFMAVLHKVHGLGDLQLGATLKELAFFYIPRAVWPAKPLAYGYVFPLKYLDPRVAFTASYAPGLAAELFLNFHIFGVIYGFFVVGILLRVTYEAFARSGEGKLMAIIYWILFVCSVHAVEGPIAPHIEFLISNLTPIFVFLGFALIIKGVPGAFAPPRKRPVRLGARMTG